MRKCILIALSLLLVLGVLLAACATPAPAPEPAPAPAPTPTSKPAPTPLELVIEGAKKEGELSIWMEATYGEKPWPQVEKNIKDMFGVDLKIKYTATRGFGDVVSKLVSEKAAGKTPDYDFATMSLNNGIDAAKGGIVTAVDWKSLLLKDVNPEVVIDWAGFNWLVQKTNAQGGIVYNTSKVSANEVPKSTPDLANPKWKGKIGMMNIVSSLARWVHQMSLKYGGDDKALDMLRAILANGTYVSTPVDLQNRFMLGEIWIGFLMDYMTEELKAKGGAAAWQNMESYEVNSTVVFIPQGAPHPNAAKLLGLYLASPTGAKFFWDEHRITTLYYPGNPSYDYLQQAKKEGVPVSIVGRDKASIDYSFSKESADLEKKVQLVLQGK